MGYRGEDLDLRTPQTWSASSSDLSSALDTAGRAYRNGPIWVDETVLACCNHAFDVALAHRAGEVRLEHLLHALTRIEAAAEALEARGVRVAALRRESATIIASEIPVGLPNGKGQPRRSEEFAEVLRLAAANAARRNAPAGIEDLLYVLFDQRADLPGLALLSRNTVRGTRETIEALPPVTRYVTETRYVPAPERITKVVNEAPRYAAETPRAYRQDYSAPPLSAPTATDSVQNSRLDALEQMVRSLSNDLAGERQVVSGLLKELNQETQAQRSDQGRLHSSLTDRLTTLEEVLTQSRPGSVPDDFVVRMGGVEKIIEQRLSDMQRTWSALSDRLQSLETAVREKSVPGDVFERLRAAVDLKPIANRLDIIEEALLSTDARKDDGDVSARLASLEGELSRILSASTASVGRVETLVSGYERQRGEMLNALVQPVVERVSTVVSSAQSHGEGLAKLAERLGLVEQAVAAEIETSAAKHQAYAQDLTEVHDALMKLNQNQHTLAGSIDQWRSDAAGDLSVIANRLGNLDRDADRPTAMLKTLSSNMDSMNKMMVERYHRRNRFWYWLFGTDDWIGASWPSQAAALEAERAKFKTPAV